MRIEMREQTTIERPAWEVREQFRDVTYHAANPVHHGVRVAVTQRRRGWCRYTQVVTFGPVAFWHDVVLTEADDGAFVNELVSGPLAGAVLRHEFEWIGPTATGVTATLSFEATGVRRVLAPVLRPVLTRRLARALEEDRLDLEAGRYTRTGHRVLHPSFG
jgi:hypothetical protein